MERELKLRQIFSECRTNEKCREFIYKKFYGYIMGIAIRYMNDRYEAQELVNDVFLKAFRNVSQFVFKSNSEKDDYYAFRGWLARITVTSALDRLRVKKRILYIEDLSETTSEIAAEISTNLNVQDILRLLDQLPDIQRLIFNLYEIEGFSHDEISENLKIPSGTSRGYLARAKAKLRELYNVNLVSYEKFSTRTY